MIFATRDTPRIIVRYADASAAAVSATAELFFEEEIFKIIN